MKTALVLGVGGQDGAYLARLLLEKGYRVVGTSRAPTPDRLGALSRLGVADRVEAEPLDLRSADAVTRLVERVEPDEVYHLAGQTSVGASFAAPVETYESLALSTLHLLEAVRASARRARVFCAGSAEVFGDTGGQPATEATPLCPRSPYAVAKASALWQVATWREAYGLHACTGLLFPHESPLRPERFVTRKIVAAAARIAAGSDETLTLGSLDVVRDWGWAEEYVDAMWRMLQTDQPEDLVLATGAPMALRTFVAEAFAAVGLDWRDHVRTSDALHRPTDPHTLAGDASRAAQVLGWTAETRGPAVVRRLVEAERPVPA